MFSLLHSAAFVKRFSSKFRGKRKSAVSKSVKAAFLNFNAACASSFSFPSGKEAPPSGTPFDSSFCPARFFRRGEPPFPKALPDFSARARKGTATKARQTPLPPYAFPFSEIFPRSLSCSVSLDAPFPKPPRIYRMSSFSFFLPPFT